MSIADELTELRRERLVRLYRADPEAYASDVLGVKWWGDEDTGQVKIAKTVLNNRKTAIRACHGVGKSHVLAGLVNFHFDLYDPSLTITTAPTQAQVEDVLWKEIRTQRRGRPGLLPKAPRMETSEDHFAVGYTARDADAFQGRHERKGAIFFDEAVGIDGQFFDSAEGISSGGDWNWACIYNPTDTGTRMFEEELSGDWKVIQISALDHPNILAGLRNEPEPYPGAVSLAWVIDKLNRWCSYVGGSVYKQPGDVEFPPGSGEWFRPGPLFESRVLGRWPSQGFDTVWSEAAWEEALVRKPIPQAPLVIGCDVARFGDDYTAIHGRRGPCSIFHERHNGWSTEMTAGRLKQLAMDYADQGEDPTDVLILIDDDGVGGGVTDQRGSFRFVGVSASEKALEDEDYPNRRSELWFATRGRVDEGRLDLSRIPENVQGIVRRQFLTPKWRLDSTGRRVVEPKADIKKRLKKSNPSLEGGSPDDADAINLAFSATRDDYQSQKEASIAYVPLDEIHDTSGYVPDVPTGGYVPQM